MPASLVKDIAAPPTLLGLAVQQDGVLVDVYSARFRILNESDLPATVVVASTEVVGTDGHLGTGRYIPWTGGARWTPAATMSRGVVEWTYQIENGDDDIVVRRPFEVLATSAASTAAAVYCLQADVAAVGEHFQTSRAIRQLQLEWVDIVQRHCSQRFVPVFETKRNPGTGTGWYFLSEPLFGVESMLVNGQTDAVTLTDYEFYGATGQHRWNPKICKISTTAQPSIFVRGSSSSTPFSSTLKTTISGVWGFVDEETQDTPSAVQRACSIGIALAAKQLDDLNPASNIAGGLKVKEETDQHTIEWGMSSGKSRPGGMAILRDPAIREVLDLYRRPIRILSSGRGL